MRALIPAFVLLLAGCSSTIDQVPDSIQGDWIRSARSTGNAPPVFVRIEDQAYVVDGIRLELSDLRKEGGIVFASALHDVRVDTAGFDLGWRVEHDFEWRVDGDSLREMHTTTATFPDSGDQPVTATLEYAYGRR